ncbi:hypothetical protein [Marinobacter sp. Hex_13]|uniref:hypothetical protein n=1 Tax=Marinobacter sp. Hex_13 TaxID=1795866 RepID=UPI00257D9A33|nr:hypothetical protein [Marinobacter sp. Hex_13]
MRELGPWLALIFRRPGRLVTGGLLILATLLAGMGLLALSGWFITATAISGILLAAGVQASINLYVPGGGIRFFAVARTVARYAERVYNHDTVLRLLTDIRVALFERLSTAGRDRRTRLRGPQYPPAITGIDPHDRHPCPAHPDSGLRFPIHSADCTPRAGNRCVLRDSCLRHDR